MKALCLHNTSDELPDEQRGRFGWIDEHFDLTVGKAYDVLAMGVFETVLQVLVRDETGAPCFCPAALFEIEEQPFPQGWRFALRDGVRLAGRRSWTQWVAVWGYAEITSDERHMNDLGERVPKALEVFEREYLKASSSEEESAG